MGGKERGEEEEGGPRGRERGEEERKGDEKEGEKVKEVESGKEG